MLENEPLQATVVPLKTSPYGWGVGFYQGDEILHIKRPYTEEAQFDWRNIAANISSDCIVAHVREPSVGTFRSENTHPFRMRQWLFAHTGAISGFTEVRSKLIQSLPDFLQRNIRGDTDSEVFFHMILAELFAEGHLEARDPDPAIVRAAIGSAIQNLNAVVPSSPPHVFTLVLSNGRQMHALRHGPDVAYIQREVKRLGKTSSLHGEPAGPDYTLVVCDLNEIPADYSPVPDRHVLTIDRDLRVSLHPL